MKIVIKGTNTELTPSLKEYVYEKVGRLERYLKRVVEADVELEVDRKHRSGEIFRAEVMLFVPRDVLRATEQATDMYAAIDLVMPKLKRQIEKYKDKIKHKRERQPRSFWAELFKSEEEAAVPARPRIVKRKRFSFTEPMSEEEAIQQMNLIGHDFFLFNNAETKRMSVVYKREDGDYGLIEPA
jgi:putative sigma-54 modulation protein